MRRSFQSSGSSPPSRYVIKKRDRDRLKRLDSKISKLKDIVALFKSMYIEWKSYQVSLDKLDLQRKKLRNKMKGYNVDKAQEGKSVEAKSRS